MSNNIMKIGVNGLQKLVERLIVANRKYRQEKLPTPPSSAMVMGAPGTAKTEVIRQIAAKYGFKVMEVHGSEIDSVDLRGIGMYNQQTGKADFVRFESILPDPEDKGEGILFLDELPQSSPLVLNAMYGLVRDGRIGNYRLPRGWFVIAAGNRESDGGVFNELPPALKNRFRHLEMIVDHKAFVNYVSKKGYNTDMVSYLQYLGQTDTSKIYNFQPELTVFPTFRTWENALIAVSHYGDDPETAITESVGAAYAADFANFAELVRHIPDPETLVKDKVYYEDLPKTIAANQKVAGFLLNAENRKKMKGSELFNAFRYFIDEHNPKNTGDTREELTILFIVAAADTDFSIFEEINESYQAGIKSGEFTAKDFGLNGRKNEGIIDLIQSKWHFSDICSQ